MAGYQLCTLLVIQRGDHSWTALISSQLDLANLDCPLRLCPLSNEGDQFSGCAVAVCAVNRHNGFVDYSNTSILAAEDPIVHGLGNRVTSTVSLGNIAG